MKEIILLDDVVDTVSDGKAEQLGVTAEYDTTDGYLTFTATLGEASVSFELPCTDVKAAALVARKMCLQNSLFNLKGQLQYARKCAKFSRGA